VAIPETLDDFTLPHLLTLQGALHKFCIRGTAKLKRSERDVICLLVLLLISETHRRRTEGDGEPPVV
jgi:hypothetical protein